MDTTPEMLRAALAAASPRLSPRPTPWASLLIHGAIVLLYGLLIGRAFLSDGLLAWSVGIVYVVYDTALLVLVFVQTLPLARAPAARAPADAGARPTLGVIVAAFNEATVLPATLAALADQTDPPELVLLADDGSTDGTEALLAARYGLAAPQRGRLSDPVSPVPGLVLRWLRLPRGGKPAALNAAALLLDTDLMVTVDADTVLDREAVAAMRAAFAADPGLVAATGVLTPVCDLGPSGRLYQWFQTYEYVRNFLARFAWMRLDSLLLISGAFAGFRRKAVLTVGGFDAACLVEDYELIHRLRRYGAEHGLGWTTAAVGGSRALTEAPASTGAFLRQRRRWFGGFLQTQYWYRAMVGDRRYGWLGLLMLPVKAADTWQPIYGLTALALLVGDLVTGHAARLGGVAGVIGLKLLVDCGFILWSIRLYRRWAAPPRPLGYGGALLAALAEPFSFQIMRHLGAALGWVTFLTGGREWSTTRGSALAIAATPPARDPAA